MHFRKMLVQLLDGVSIERVALVTGEDGRVYVEGQVLGHLQVALQLLVAANRTDALRS